ncbi:GerAB/ArcD/ProY family transporter [Clostridium sp. WILCCON 0269]|uniref:GerAB/ArcD/ProY family transporter n=1 Tax=Candidatus Clostridium eludens TaxID=3381663 RepID=A0ABW8SL63_9CLOT
MNKAQNTFLTPSQFTLTLKSAVVGIETMYIANNIMKFAKQDSWISCIVGTVYPLYMVIIANYMCKKFPKDNILILSKKCFGKFLGSILNIIFISFFLFMLTSEFSGYTHVFRVYTTSFLKPYQVLFTALIPITYIAYKGIKPLGRLNEVGFYLTVGLVVLPMAVLAYGSFLNLMPVFGSGLSGILKGSKETVFAFSGMEIMFLIYPFLQDNKKLLKCGIVNVVIVAFIYTWTVFATIFYLGIETSPEYLWPVLTLADSINIPIVNSFRFIFISLWSLVQFKCIATYYFVVSYGLNQSVKKIPAEAFVLLLYPVIIIITMLYGNPTTRGEYTNKLIVAYVIFNLTYVSAAAILIHFKKGDAYEKV